MSRWRPGDAGAVGAGVVAGITGYAVSFALVLAGLANVGATPSQAASGLFALCMMLAILNIVLPWVLRIPLSFAWSTPGAATLLAATAPSGGFSAAVGAFIISASLIMLSGLWPALQRAVTSIPKPVASAMLAGILLPICVTPVVAMQDYPAVLIPMVLVWLVSLRWLRQWAVPAAMAVAVIGIIIMAGPKAAQAVVLPQLTLVMPQFEVGAIIGIALPLFVVTLAGQNIPGFAVLKLYDYPQPVRTSLVSSGAASAVAALGGGHGVNVAAISAALMASPEAHPDQKRRWIATTSSGFVYAILGLASGTIAAIMTSAPPELVAAAAGLALLTALIAALEASLQSQGMRLAAIVTFVVSASGITLWGVGSAFWGLLCGIAIAVLLPSKTS